VLRLGRNNGVFSAEASNHDLVSAITGATDNVVTRRAHRRATAAERVTDEPGPERKA
jgi:D-xylose transport system ATP-binding protein